MSALLAAVRKQRSFLCSPAVLLALSLCGAAAFVWQGRDAGRTPATPAGAEMAEGGVGSRPPQARPRHARFERLAEIGRGKGVIFSPDLSAPANRRIYERLGFAYFEGADWRDVLAEVRAYNLAHPGRRIETLILEAHGTNGHGLKLQEGGSRRAARSYISVGGLQQQLAGAGLSLCVIAACNSGRLFRPEIYYTLNTRTGDPLFLPATRGVLNASPGFRATERDVPVLYPASSRLEAANEAHVREFAPLTVAVLGAGSAGAAIRGDARFVVSDTLLAMLLDDPGLSLTAEGYVTERSAAKPSAAESESLVRRFITFVNEVAAREYGETSRAGANVVSSAANR
jgi:hypothetical protein